MSSCWHDFWLNFNFNFFVCFCWFASVLPLPPPPKKKKMLIVHYSSVFDCKFIQKSYVNFWFIKFIFVMVKDTFLLTYPWKLHTQHMIISWSPLKIPLLFHLTTGISTWFFFNTPGNSMSLPPVWICFGIAQYRISILVILFNGS